VFTSANGMRADDQNQPNDLDADSCEYEGSSRHISNKQGDSRERDGPAGHQKEKSQNLHPRFLAQRRPAMAATTMDTWNVSVLLCESNELAKSNSAHAA